jgi:hypothetical protein
MRLYVELEIDVDDSNADAYAEMGLDGRAIALQLAQDALGHTGAQVWEVEEL